MRLERDAESTHLEAMTARFLKTRVDDPRFRSSDVVP
jgi:hypothetical protein